jgi:hypothetical protein
MKRTGIYIRLLIVIFLSLLWWPCSAGNTMTTSSDTIGANEIFTVDITITNDSLFVAFQFDMPIPTGFTFIPGSAVLNPERIDSHALESYLLPGNILRVFSYSQENLAYLGNSGIIMSFQLRSGTFPGNFALNLSSPVIGNSESINILTGSVNGTALVLTPDIFTPISSLDFDRTPLEQYKDRTFMIYNLGNQPLNIISITFNSTYFTIVGNTTFAIPASQNSTVTIRFNSTVKGTYDKIMTIQTDDPDEATITASLHAHSYTVNELHTGNMSGFSGHSALLSFSVNNMEPFSGFQFDLKLPSVLTYIPGSIVLSGRETNHIISASMVTGNKLRVVCYSPDLDIFAGNSGEVLQVAFEIKGLGGGYSLILSDVILSDTLGENLLSDFFNGTLQVAASDIYSASSVNFGNLSLLQTGQQNLRIYNYGNDTLKIEQVICSPSCFSTGTEGPVNISANGYLDIPLQFHDTIEGVTTGTVRFISNDPDEYHYNVNLQANVYIPNYLFIPNLEAWKTDTITIPVKVSNYENFTGFQFDIQIPTCLTFINDSARLSARAEDHIIIAEIVSQNLLRVLAYSLTNTPFSGDTGSVATIDFDVHAQNNETYVTLAPINAILGNSLEENILWGTASGNLTIKYPPKLTGIFSYNNSSDTPLDSVWIFLIQDGDILDSTRTNLDGSYTFQDVYSGTYTITAQTNKGWAGVNGTDALKILRHFTGLSNLGIPIRITAADVNNSGGVNATDALGVSRRFVGLDTSFTKGDWIFERPGGGNYLYMQDTDQSVNFYGLCVGDVNGSNIPPQGDKNIFGVEINSLATIQAGPGDEIFIPVAINREENIGAISLVLNYPAELMTVTGVNICQGTPVFSVKPGILKLVWADLNPIHTLESEPIAFIKIVLSEEFSPGERIEILNGSNLTEVCDWEGNPLRDIQVYIPTISCSENSRPRVIYLYPNPVRQYSSLIFTSPESGSAEVSIYNLFGICVDSFEVSAISMGLNNIPILVKDWVKGEYILNFQFSGKIIDLQYQLKMAVVN